MEIQGDLILNGCRFGEVEMLPDKPQEIAEVIKDGVTSEDTAVNRVDIAGFPAANGGLRYSTTFLSMKTSRRQW